MAKIKERLKTLSRTCAVCGKAIKVILYKDRTYRGGHFFGKIPFYKKGTIDFKNTEKVKIGGLELNVLKNLPQALQTRGILGMPKVLLGLTFISLIEDSMLQWNHAHD